MVKSSTLRKVIRLFQSEDNHSASTSQYISKNSIEN